MSRARSNYKDVGRLGKKEVRFSSADRSGYQIVALMWTCHSLHGDSIVAEDLIL